MWTLKMGESQTDIVRYASVLEVEFLVRRSHVLELTNESHTLSNQNVRGICREWQPRSLIMVPADESFPASTYLHQHSLAENERDKDKIRKWYTGIVQNELCQKVRLEFIVFPSFLCLSAISDRLSASSLPAVSGVPSTMFTSQA